MHIPAFEKNNTDQQIVDATFIVAKFGDAFNAATHSHRFNSTFCFEQSFKSGKNQDLKPDVGLSSPFKKASAASPQSVTSFRIVSSLSLMDINILQFTLLNVISPSNRWRTGLYILLTPGESVEQIWKLVSWKRKAGLLNLLFSFLSQSCQCRDY